MLNIVLVISLIVLVGWLINRFWIEPSSSSLYRYRRRSGINEYIPVVSGIVAFVLLLHLFFTPSTPKLAQLFRDNPQTFEFHVGVGELDTSFVTELLRGAAAQAVRDQIQEIAGAPAPAPGSPDQPTPEPPPAPAEDPAVPPPESGQRTASEVECIPGFRCFKYKNMIIELEKGLYDSQVEELTVGTAQAYDYVTERTGLQFSSTVHARYDTEDGCSLNGYTYFSDHLPKVHTCNGISVADAIIIMAHEFGHQLGADNFDCYLGTDFYFSEGLATWGAGDYWLQGKKNFGAYAKALGASSLQFNTNADSDKYRVYASFVEYIMVTYGPEAFYKLYGSASGGNCQAPFGFDHNDYSVLGDLPGKPGQALTQEDLFNGWRVWLSRLPD